MFVLSLTEIKTQTHTLKLEINLFRLKSQIKTMVKVIICNNVLFD